MSDAGRVMVVAGEASADAHAANLIRELRELKPGLEVFGVGGEKLAEAGADLLLDFSKVGVVGITEIIPEIPKFYRAYKELIRGFKRLSPDGVILVDLPDFNLFLAGRIKKINPDAKIIYYISPQAWGWRPGRTRKIAKRADAMLTLFPFEVDFYNEREPGFDVEFVGHPLAEKVKPSSPIPTLRQEFGIAERGRVLSLLPGSRRSEVGRYLPTFARAAVELRSIYKDPVFLLALAATVDGEQVSEILEDCGVAEIVKVISGRTYDVLAVSDMAMVASGTATLETALLGVPMVIVGAVSNFSYYLTALIVDTWTIGLPNVVAGKKIVPELLQFDFTADHLVREITRVLDHPEKTAKIKEDLERVKKALGSGGASKKAAEAVFKRIYGPAAKGRDV